MPFKNPAYTSEIRNSFLTNLSTLRKLTSLEQILTSFGKSLRHKKIYQTILSSMIKFNQKLEKISEELLEEILQESVKKSSDLKAQVNQRLKEVYNDIDLKLDEAFSRLVKFPLEQEGQKICSGLLQEYSNLVYKPTNLIIENNSDQFKSMNLSKSISLNSTRHSIGRKRNLRIKKIVEEVKSVSNDEENSEENVESMMVKKKLPKNFFEIRQRLRLECKFIHIPKIDPDGVMVSQKKLNFFFSFLTKLTQWRKLYISTKRSQMR